MYFTRSRPTKASASPVVTELEYMVPPSLESLSGITTMISMPALPAASTLSGMCMKSNMLCAL